MKTASKTFLEKLVNLGKTWGLPFLVIFAIALLFRLPNLLSRSLWFDGDEGIVGIMARDWLNGRAFPTYFYGQNYGFSLFEVLSVAFWIKLLGSSVWALRLGGLTLFALSTTFLYKALENKEVALKWRVFSVLLILSFPSWMMWGMMVRGGYVNALLCIGVLVYLFTRIQVKWGWALLASFFFAAAFESHVLLLLPVLPFLLKIWLDEKRPWWFLFTALLGAGLWVVLIKFSNFYDNGWSTPTMQAGIEYIPERLQWFTENVSAVFGDFFFYEVILSPPKWWSILLSISLGIWFLYLLFVSGKQRSLEVFLWIASLSVIVLFSAMFPKFSPRYLLGFFTGFLFLAVFQVFFQKTKQHCWFLIPLLVIQFIGIGVGSKIKRDWYDFDGNQLEAFQTLFEEVQSKEKKAVFMTDNLGQWQWNYLYGDQIPCSIFRRTERVSTYSERVYSVYERDEKQVALIGLWGIFWEMDYLEGFNDYRYQVADKYYFMDHQISHFIPAAEKKMQE